MALFLEGSSKNKSLLLGDQHSSDFWDYNYTALRKFKPDFLLLEVIGKHRYMNTNERVKAFNKLPSSMKNRKNMGYSKDAFILGGDLNIPMIGIDVWDEPYVFPKHWDEKDKASNYEYSHNIRESNMLKVLKEFEPQGKVLLIVGAEHLRDDSKLTKFAIQKNIDVKFFKL